MRHGLPYALLLSLAAAPLAAQNDTTPPAPRSDTVHAAAPPHAIVPKAPPEMPPDTVPAAPAHALVSKAPPAGAEEHGIESTLYLSMDSWVTPYVEHLIRAGVLQGLDPLTRPLKRADVARAVAAVDTSNLARSVKSQLRLLAWELEERQDTVRWKLDGGLAVEGASDASRWTQRPAGDTARVFPSADLAFSLEMPHFALVTHPYVDNRLKYDPEYIGKKDRFVAGRNDEAYLIGSWKYFDVFFGLADRNWGSPDVEGLLLSTSPYAYDHLFLRLGPRRLRLEMVATELNDLPYWADSVGQQQTATLARRYLMLHRLVVIPSDRLAFSLSEAMLYANEGGVSRSWEPWYLNPLNLWLLAQYQGKTTGNSLLAGDVTWQARRDLRLFGQLYLDDIQVDRRQQSDREPPGYGFTLDASGGAMGGAVSWTAFYTKVTNLAYRTPANEEQYTSDSVGIARNHDDYDQMTAKVTTAPGVRALVTGEVTYIRQGVGDIRTHYPAVSQYADSLWFLTGVVQRTLRVAAQAEWTPTPGLNLSTDLGRHFIWNANHVAGVRADRWVWRVKVELRHRVTGAVPWKD